MTQDIDLGIAWGAETRSGEHATCRGGGSLRLPRLLEIAFACARAVHRSNANTPSSVRRGSAPQDLYVMRHDLLGGLIHEYELAAA